MPEIDRAGGHTNVLVKKSQARGLAFGNSCENGRRFLNGSALI